MIHDFSRLSDSISNPFLEEWKHYVERCAQMVTDFNADALIFAANTGCKYHWAGARLIKEKLYIKFRARYPACHQKQMPFYRNRGCET